MTRNAAGKNFDQYHRRFLATIIGNLAPSVVPALPLGQGWVCRRSRRRL
jgi:hypothetical protein